MLLIAPLRSGQKRGNKLKLELSFQKAAKSYYKGQKYDVTWSFANGFVSIDGGGGMQRVVYLPVEELIQHQLKPGGLI